MGENEQGGMLRTVVVVGLVAMVALIITLGVVGLSANMKSTTNGATDGIQKEIKNVNGGVEEVTDDFDTSNHAYTFDDTNKTAVIGSTRNFKAQDKGSLVVPSYVIRSGIRYTVVGIGKSAYKSLEFTDVAIPDTIKSIGDYAFYNDTKLTKVTIGTDVQTIGDSAFRSTALSSVTVPDNVKTIGPTAFANNIKLTTVTIGKGVETIGDWAFSNTALSSVTVPDNVKTIGAYAFKGIPNNKDGFVSIGKDTTYIQDGWSSSFGSYTDSTGNDIGYKPIIRS